MSRLSPIFRAGLLALLVVPFTTSCDKLSALADRVRGKSPATEPQTVAGGTRLTGGKPHHISEADFNTLTADPDRLVLVDFYADWCAPCRVLAPILNTIAAENPERLLVLKVNVDHAQNLAKRLGVTSIPDLRFFRGGSQIDSMVGTPPVEDLRRIVQAHLPVAAPAAPAAPAPVGMVEKLKDAVTKREQAATPPPPAPPPGPAQPPIQPIKKGDDWMPAGMSKERPPTKP